MIYIDTHSADVFYNFGVEYYFSRHKKLDDDVFLIWRTTPTLMIGKFQNTLEEIDASYARERGITIVRRLSGGGTIYTDMGGWQFSYITKTCGIEIEFERFIAPIVDILRSLGLNASLTGRNDITVDGKKVSGNTQYKLGETTVHHGSLLFSTDLGEMARASTPNPYKITSKAISSVRERVTNISEKLEVPMTTEEFRDVIVKRLTDGVYEITPEDDAEIVRIAREKFADKRVIYAAVPKFEIEKELHLPGGSFTIGYTVAHGVITEAGFTGDFFAGATPEELSSALKGCEFTPEAVTAALAPFDGRIYKVDTKDLVRGIFE